jgi:alkylhydroperoxidase family enzyme
MARLPDATRDDFPENLVYVWDALARDGAAPGAIFRALGNNPDLLRAYTRMGNALWTHCGLDLATRELLILRTALRCESVYEWHQHVRIARGAGIPDDKINVLSNWRESTRFSDDERMLLAYVDACFDAGTDGPPREVHDALAARFPPSTVVGVNLLTNFYVMTAKFLAAMEVEPETAFIGWKV